MKFLFVCFQAILTLSLSSGCGSDTHQDPPPPATQPIKNCAAWPEQLLQFEQQHNSAVLAVTAGPDCSLYLAGYYNSTQLIEASGNSTGFIRRLSLNAANQVNTDWTYTLDTVGADSIELLQWNGTELIFVGRTNSAIDGMTNKGQFDLVAGKLNAQGIATKVSQFGTEKPDKATALIKSQNNEWMLFGYTDVYIPTNYVESWEDGLQIQLKETPNHFEMIAFYTSNSPVPDKFTTAVALPDQPGLYLAGQHIAEGQQRGVWLKQMNATGQHNWASRISAFPLDSIVHLSPVRQNTVRVLGSTYAILGESTYGGADIYSAQANLQSGDLSDFSQYGTPQNDWATAGWSDVQQHLLAGEVSRTDREATVAFSFIQRGNVAELNELATQQDHFSYGVTAAHGLVFVAGQQVKGLRTIASINSRKLP